MKKITELLKKYKEIILYLVFGVATTLVNFLIYTLLVGVCGVGMTVSNAAAWCGAVVFAFVTNKLFVFESKQCGAKVLIKEALSFLGSRLVSGIIEITAPTLLYSIGFDLALFGIKGFAAKAVVSVVVIMLNYVCSKLFVFKE